jgi:hypothetical protein
VIAVVGQLLDARAAFLERFVAVALQHQGSGTPDIDLGYNTGKIARLRSEIRLTPIIAWVVKLRVKVATNSAGRRGDNAGLRW